MMILPEEDRSKSKAAELNGFATDQVLAKWWNAQSSFVFQLPTK